MNRWVKWIVSLSVIGMVTSSIAFDRLETVQHFSQMMPYVKQLVKVKGAKHVLLVFDNDGTLTAAPQDFASVGWWNWQAHLLEHDPKSPYLEAHNFKGLLQIQGDAFALEKMNLVSAKAPGLIHQFQQEGLTTMVSTDRSGPFFSMTLRQLNQVGLHFSAYAPKNQQGFASLPAPMHPCGNQKLRKVFYQDGLLFVGANTKGNTLQWLLKKLGQAKRYTGILLIDDTLKNDATFVQQYKALAKEKHLDVYALHYTKENAWQQAVATEPMRHQKMNQQWLMFEKVTRGVFAKPNLP